MSRRSFFDRMTGKTAASLLRAHLQEHYRLAPAAATLLADELMCYGQLAHPQVRPDGQIVYQAVALDEPPGKPLSECQKLAVRLTLFDESDLARQRDHGRRHLTQCVMVRLAREARDQGAALTVEDLAWLLRLSPATVKRHRRQIRARAIDFALRGDLTDAGPATTHRTRIVKLFLLGYSDSDIAIRCHHQLDCVEAYIYDFLRVASLAREGKAAGTICRLVKLSASKVKTIVRLHEQLSGDPDYAEPVRHWLDVFSLQRRMKKGGNPT